jgi:hypothetical protein
MISRLLIKENISTQKFQRQWATESVLIFLIPDVRALEQWNNQALRFAATANVCALLQQQAYCFA